MNAGFQRIARRDKKAFLSDQCKDREENNRMGKTRDLFKKIRDTKGTFHAKMGSLKDRNGMDLTEVEDIRRDGKHTQSSVQFSSVPQSCLTLCDPMNLSTTGLPVHHQLPEFTQTHVHELVMPSSHLILSSPSPPAPNPSQHQGLFQ